MSTQESEQLGGDAPIRISARERANGADPARRPLVTLDAELLVFAAGVVALLVVAAIDSGFSSQRAWTLITVLAAAFIVRRR